MKQQSVFQAIPSSKFPTSIWLEIEVHRRGEDDFSPTIRRRIKPPRTPCNRIIVARTKFDRVLTNTCKFQRDDLQSLFFERKIIAGVSTTLPRHFRFFLFYLSSSTRDTLASRLSSGSRRQKCPNFFKFLLN